MDDDRMDEQVRRDSGLPADGVPDAAAPANEGQAEVNDAPHDDPGAPEDRLGLESQERIADMATRRGTRA